MGIWFGYTLPSSSGGLPVASAANQVLVSTGPGTTYAAMAAAGVRVILIGPFNDSMTGAGWVLSTPAGGASAVWSSSPSRLVLTCVNGSVGSCGAYADGYLASGDTVDFAIRVRVTAGDGSNQTRLVMTLGIDSTNQVQLIFFTDGSIEGGYVYNGNPYFYWFVSNTIAGISPAVRAGGNLWLRLHRTPTAIVWLWAVGVGGALPAQWNTVFSSVEREVAGQFPQVQQALAASEGTQVGVYAATPWGNTDLGVEILSSATGLPGGFGGA